ncbi:MAG: CHAT domain-containing protein [Aromatoleum sp.]|uniref:CHAT domain-containing protein n=1 Tax=Aromatoleum sp. TaxID=2307007 RepID=UPI002894A127|nr:CHAT domain-containing protein [Aromatoleum sp.]MDT3672457.1 CHAT domain-containing protein [Aromatoleum sp.]
MPTMTKPGQIEIRLPGKPLPVTGVRDALPPALAAGSRAGDGTADPFLDRVLKVEARYSLVAPGRAGGDETTAAVGNDRLLALETDDGTSVCMRADKLREDLARVHPEALGADGSLDVGALRDPTAAARGITDWIWSGMSVLSLGSDSITDAALDKAKEWLAEWLGDGAGELASGGASWLGAKALMWAIENRLPGEPGIYQWRNGGTLAASDRCEPGDARLAAGADAPMLLFIHGTGSHTLGSFKDLRSGSAAGDWEPLARRFGGRMFGFEHRTFSESPIDNAIALARALPAEARLSLVTHSRGGLVGDLLCLAGLSEAEIAAYRRAAPPNTVETTQQKQLRDLFAAREQESLRALRRELETKNFRIERYIRVASPSRGTLLLSDNLDVFMSALLSLTGRFVGAVAGPAGGAALSALKRIVLEIADKRIEPRLLPGIEAMLTDAPMATLLAGAQRKQGIDMAIVSGDVEGGSVLKRLGACFTDWMLFDRVDNDLVVDTESMYAGLATRNGARYLFDQGASVNHFSYFANRSTRGALRDWLTADDPAALPVFAPLVRRGEPDVAAARSRAALRAPPLPDTRPVVIVLPGIMGSHLEIRAADRPPGDGDRVWFDFFDLATGGLSKIRFDRPDVHEEDLFDMAYGELTEHLAGSHFVIRCPYDWRRPLQADGAAADRLADLVKQALAEHPSQPVRLLAHSLGGVVARAMIAKHPQLWAEAVRRPGSRLVMLGTPNNGSHMMVEALLGKSDTMRKLTHLDLVHDLQDVLDIVGGFPGALQLLPRPDFIDSGPSWEHGYLDAAVWPALAQLNRDRWFGDRVGATPVADTVAQARALWQGLLATNDAPQPVERVHYVFGKAENTPCGLVLDGDRLKMVGTPEGDGSVSWASGRLANLPDEQCWFMPADHGGLADTREHFPALVDLLETGSTARLGRVPALRGAAAATVRYDAPPPVLPTEEELARSIIGTRPQPRRPAAAVQSLHVSVTAMDLRFARQPVICGHYIGDPIAGAELSIDRYLVQGALRQRERLGVYAGEVGSSAIVLQARGAEDRLRGTGRGAVIVGLGRFGDLTTMDIGETVRAGVLRFLLHSLDRQGTADAGAGENGSDGDLTLASLLVGYNSTAHINVEDSVAMIVRGVIAANRQFADAMPRARLRVARLELIELFLDTAITAAHAVRALPERIAADLRRLEARIDTAEELREGEGARPRLAVFARFGYWPRLIVTDADRPDDAGLRPSPLPGGALQPPSRPVATRLKYVFLSERARAESVVQQRQPGLIEALVKNAIHRDEYSADLARTLFQLMIPLDFKAAARDTEKLVLVVDGYTANLPWEMLQAEDQPMALKTAMVRKFESTRYRRNPLILTRKVACIIANPSTRGFLSAFGASGAPVPAPVAVPDSVPLAVPANDGLPDLPGAATEGAAIRDLLLQCGYEVSHGEGLEALDVFARLFRQAWRILAIAAHGVFQVVAHDGRARTGVVLSDGLLLTAAEIGQMEAVPELVFLNCCHLGAMSASPETANRLAYSLARELIEIGVRCVVVAGWQVNDAAAQTFATTFFDAFVARGQPFGAAVFAARRATWERFPQYNTWGAYQAYGEPEHMLEPPREETPGWGTAGMVSPAELLSTLAGARVDLGHDRVDRATLEGRLAALLGSAPAGWQALPEVQAALGAVYGELGADAFEPACAAYCRAIEVEDHHGRVPIRIIEQLADLEVRTGEARGDLALIDRAIVRLRGLIDLCSHPDAATGVAGPMERCEALGSALTRKAAILAATGGAWTKVETVLREGRDAYACGADSTDALATDVGATTKRLQFDWLLLADEADDARKHLAALATRNADAAHRRFSGSDDFLDAMKPADAEFTLRLVAGLRDRDVDDLERIYRDAAGQMLQGAHRFDAAAKEIGLLARFAALRGRRGDAALAARLDKLAARLRGSPAPPAPSRPKLPAPPRPPSAKRPKKKA